MNVQNFLSGCVCRNQWMKSWEAYRCPSDIGNSHMPVIYCHVVFFWEAAGNLCGTISPWLFLERYWEVHP